MTCIVVISRIAADIDRHIEIEEMSWQLMTEITRLVARLSLVANHLYGDSYNHGFCF